MSLTHDEIHTGCLNLGINLDCGGCAGEFYTGIGAPIHPHDEHCTRRATDNSGSTLQILAHLGQSAIAVLGWSELKNVDTVRYYKLVDAARALKNCENEGGI